MGLTTFFGKRPAIPRRFDHLTIGAFMTHYYRESCRMAVTRRTEWSDVRHTRCQCQSAGTAFPID